MHNITFLCKLWFSFGIGYHFSKTRIQPKHAHDVMTIRFMLGLSTCHVKFYRAKCHPLMTITK